MKLIIGVTGASGSRYALRLLEALEDKGIDRVLIMSKNGEEIAKHELGEEGLRRMRELSSETYPNDLQCPYISGSSKFDGMVVVPCSMKTLSEISIGYSRSAISRIADVALKEGRRLILVPRETPLSAIHLENMLRASRAGAIILPAMPAFYMRPKNIDDLVTFVVGRILDVLGIDNDLYRRLSGWAT
ncbi:MAG: UbiX family flavin prenyltransferase [Candidatus Bathyarchaeia archaeon]